MRYARLTPGQGFRPINSFLYYLQRIVVAPHLRRACVSVFRQWIRIRQGSGPKPAALAQHQLIDSLRSEGYAELGPLLSDRQCAEIHGYFSDKKLTGRGDGASGYTIGNVPPHARLSEYSLGDIIGSPHILELANDRRLLEMASSYIGCKPTISQLGLRWSFPAATVQRDLQQFHRDSEDWRYLKVLVYLTDVSAGDGPHVYVRSTHKSGATMRLHTQSDSEVEQQYGRENLIVAMGQRGFGFAVDTAGIHKGQRPTEKPRLMLQIQYSLFRSFAYVYEPQPYQGWPPFDRYINRLILAYPR